MVRLLLHSALTAFSIRFSVMVVLSMVAHNCWTQNSNLSNWNKKTKSLGFTENKGQFKGTDQLPAPYVLFKVESPGLNIWITETGLTYQFIQHEERTENHSNTKAASKKDGDQEEKKIVHWKRVDMTLKDAQIKKENILTEDEITQGRVDYYFPHCPDGVFNVRTYSKIRITQIYPGIDWVLYTSTSGSLKYDFVVAPNANPNNIQLLYEGNGSINIQKDQLSFNNDLGKVVEGKLYCYQKNKTNKVESSYMVTTNNKLDYTTGINKPANAKAAVNTTIFSQEVTIQLGEYDKSDTLIIDPKLVWGTLFGGNSLDGIVSIDTDSENNLLATGYTFSHIDFPVQSYGNFFEGNIVDESDIFVLKFDSIGQLIWSTYYGGSTIENGSMITTDKANNVWIVAETESDDLPVEDAGTYYEDIFSSSGDIFILKFDKNGNRIWATYYGSDLAKGFAIEADNYGHIWITGETDGSFPTYNTPYSTFGGFQDAFILKFDTAGNRMLASLWGGSEYDGGHSICSDADGNIFITGQTASPNFPTQNANTFFQQNIAGGRDAYLAKFDSTGNPLWSTYFGGNNNDNGYAIETDEMGNIFAIGYTKSDTNFPLLNAGTFYQDTLKGTDDTYLVKFDNHGNLLWSTYYGGSDADQMRFYDHMAIDKCNNVYVTFRTASPDITTKDMGNCHYYKGNHGGGDDCFIAQFNNDGDLNWATYIGGNGRDQYNPLALQKDNTLIMGGEFINYTISTSLPLLNPGGVTYFEDIPQGADDSFILKFEPPETTFSQSQTNAKCTSCNGSATVTVLDCNTPPYTFTWSNGTVATDINSTTHTVSGLCAGEYSVIVESCNTKTDTVYYTITSESEVITANATDSICVGDSVLIGNVYRSTPGIYTDTLIEGSSYGCDSITTIALSVVDVFTTNTVDTICVGDSVLIGNEFRSTAGSYNDTLTASGGFGCDSIIVTRLVVRNNTINFNFDTSFYCLADPDPIPSNNGSTPGVFTIDNNGTIDSLTGMVDLQASGIGDFLITFTANNVCRYDSSVSLQIDSCLPLPTTFFVPSAFSPNGDQINDTFFPVITNISEDEYRFYIFNRVGEEIFYSDAPYIGWNGRLKNNTVQSGIYVWKIAFSDQSSQKQVFIGKVIILN